ncbi:MAG: hypothetical protein LBR67_03770 [Dysgonamonadaceae bacterium]|nr:hypothetical protein [Dysgonamonadaceae bacterium]
MNTKRKTLTKLVLLLGCFACFFGCKEMQGRHDETVYIPVEYDTVTVKISYPEKWTKNDKIIIWSMPPLDQDFFPDSIDANVNQLSLPPVLRSALLVSGYVNIEYTGRNDSIVILNRKYCIADLNTKAVDLDHLLEYLHSNKALRDKKIILIGYSEGGSINIKTASKRQSDISAMIQLAAGALPGKQITEYQKEQNFLATMLYITQNGRQDAMDRTTNRVSSLDSYHKADSNSVIQYLKENIEPVEDLISQFDNVDSIYFHLDSYLWNRWEKESLETKLFWINHFENYYRFFAGRITPNQITVRTFTPENYYPLIQCPVLAVQGTKDELIDCYPNIEKMDSLLVKGGNRRFESMILEGYYHSLVKGDKEHEYALYQNKVVSMHRKPNLHIEDSVIMKIIEWIDKQ